MPHATLNDTYVMLCDWRGRCVWTSAKLARLKPGEFIWEHLTADSQKTAKAALSRAVTLRENQSVEVINRDGERFRGWMWPLDAPDVAVCLLGISVPANLVRLTKRERGVLELLAQGIETRSIATQLDVSLSTVHTHMKRAREKLGVRSVEALISLAARYCYPINRPLDACPVPHVHRA